MRPQQNRRIRGRSNNNGNNRRGSNPLTRNYESNGPDVKIRGNAQHIADKYMTLARDVQAAGDRIMAENYLQHAEHYMRIILSAQPQFVPPLKADLPYEEDVAHNIVDLSSNEAAEVTTTQENLFHLVINKDVEAPPVQEKTIEQNDADNISAPQEIKPKTERVRRLARRRLPRPDMVEHSKTEDDTSLLPAFVTQPQDKVRGDVDTILAPVEPQETNLSVRKKPTKKVVKENTEAAEKPQRKRRSIKITDEENVNIAAVD